MVKLPNTIYERVVTDSLSRGNTIVPREIMINTFVLEGYGREKAEKWIKELAKVHNHRLEHNIIRF